MIQFANAKKNLGSHDPEDNRQSVRNNLYKRWFDGYKKKNKLTLQTEELDFGSYIVYTGMIIRNDHPEYDLILNDYKDFVKRALKTMKVNDK